MRSTGRSLFLILVLLLNACGGGDLEPTTGGFTLAASENNLAVQEGNATGTTVQLQITRGPDHRAPLTLRVRSDDPAAAAMQPSFTSLTLDASETSTTLTFAQPVGVLPVRAHTQSWIVSATDGLTLSSVNLELAVQPTNAPDVYLLIGQSNMVGFSGDGTRDISAGGPDEPDERIFQLNVTPNDPFGIFNNDASWSDPALQTQTPRIVRAEDPLHLPFNEVIGGKEGDYIGLGLSFAKAALANTDANIVLVPAAWSGTAFCRGGNLDASWNATSPEAESLGNTNLFDRAVTRTNLTLAETGGVLRGILWHQGEGDANSDFPACADLYQENLTHLIEQLRLRINADGRGAEARALQANIPFVLGTLSRGRDANSDFSVLTPLAQQIDNIHRSIPGVVPHTAISVNDDLIPANGFPCGNTSCIHFGAEALREMGQRYYQGLLRAASR